MDLGALIGGLFDPLFKLGLFSFSENYRKKVTGSGLTGAEKEANEFTAAQQEDAQVHDKEMADYNQLLAEQWYQKHQTKAAQVQEMQDAGLNPALMYSNGPGSIASPATFGSSGGSGSSSVSPSQNAPADLFAQLGGFLLRAKEVEANQKLKGSQTRYWNEMTDKIGNENSVFLERLDRERKAFDLNQQIGYKSIEEVDAKIKVDYALQQKYLQDVDESKARQLVDEMDAALKRVDYATRAEYNQACLALVQSEQKLNQAQEELAIAEKYKTQSENSYMKIKVKNAQREYDDAHNQVELTVKKIGKEADLTDKEIEYFEEKFNLQVISAVNGAINAAKFNSGTRFQGGSIGFSNYLDSMGKIAKKAGNKLSGK